MLKIFQAFSSHILKVEKLFVIILAAAVTCLMLLNVVTRKLEMSLYWVDELVIYSMIWLVMIGASVCLRQRTLIAVTLLESLFGERLQRIIFIAIDVIIVAFAVMLIWLNWLWFAPIQLFSTGFDFDAFSQIDFNFIYQEPTTTIGVPKYLIWLIMPIAAVTMCIHAVTNLFERLIWEDQPSEQTEVTQW